MQVSYVCVICCHKSPVRFPIPCREFFTFNMIFPKTYKNGTMRSFVKMINVT